MCMLTACYPTRALQAWEQKIGALLVSELLLANTKSGNKDGIGIGAPDGSYVKWDEPAGDIVFTDVYNRNIKQFITAPLIAHVRAISTGATAKEGAHPFRVDNLLLAHNGTFTNYRKFLGEFANKLNDKNPVDSHVIAHLLAKEVGGEELGAQHLTDTLDEVLGSFALLVTDAVNGSMWVVPGANPLYIQKSGPFWLVNTSKLNLDSMSNNIAGIAKLLYDKEWVTGDTTRIEEFTANVLTRKGLAKVSDLEKPEPIANTYYRGGARGYAGMHGYAGAAKIISSEEARTRAEWADLIVSLPGIDRLELTLSCFILLESEWWKADVECLEVLYSTLEQITKDSGSSIKIELWESIMQMTNQNAYAVIAAYDTICFPYMLNSVDLLRKFAREIVEDIKNGNHIPVGANTGGDTNA